MVAWLSTTIKLEVADLASTDLHCYWWQVAVTVAGLVSLGCLLVVARVWGWVIGVVRPGLVVGPL